MLFIPQRAIDLLDANVPRVVVEHGLINEGRGADHGEQADVVLALSRVGRHVNVLIGHIAADQIAFAESESILRRENGESIARALPERHLLHRRRTHAKRLKVQANLTHVGVAHAHAVRAVVGPRVFERVGRIAEVGDFLALDVVTGAAEDATDAESGGARALSVAAAT